MVPLLGPSSSRSLVGRVVDSIINPLSMVHSGNVGNAVRTAQIPMSAVTFRANNFEPFNDVKYNSLDSYARTRSLYYQSRAGRINAVIGEPNNNKTNDDQFESFFEDPS